MHTPNWLDSTLWAISRAYRRRKIRQSRVYSELISHARPHQAELERVLERPAILSDAWLEHLHRPVVRLGAQKWPPYTANELLREKLADEELKYGCDVGTGFMQLDYTRGRDPLDSPGVYARACSACNAGDHGIYGQGACLCPCHRAGGAA